MGKVENRRGHDADGAENERDCRRGVVLVSGADDDEVRQPGDGEKEDVS